jgi:hypothetical protein
VEDKDGERSVAAGVRRVRAGFRFRVSRARHADMIDACSWIGRPEAPCWRTLKQTCSVIAMIHINVNHHIQRCLFPQSNSHPVLRHWNRPRRSQMLSISAPAAFRVHLLTRVHGIVAIPVLPISIRAIAIHPRTRCLGAIHSQSADSSRQCLSPGHASRMQGSRIARMRELCRCRRG